MDYKVQALNNREFGTVWIGRDNLGLKVVENGWAKVMQIAFQNDVFLFLGESTRNGTL